MHGSSSCAPRLVIGVPVLDWVRPWDSMEPDKRINTSSTYAVEHDCGIAPVKRIAESMRHGRFSVVDDSVEKTLAAWVSQRGSDR